MAIAKKIVRKAPAKTTKKVAKVEPAPMEAKIFSMAGKEVGSIALPMSIFGAPWRRDLVHQVVTGMQANLRQNRAHTKDRAEVSGGGKKPWKQKGTGQARHGSSRSPLWRHGGTTFGPRTERNYSEKINRKMRIQALASVLSRKAKDGELVFVDSLSFAAPKTKEALIALIALSKASKANLLSKKGARSALVALTSYNEGTIKSFRNLKGIATEEVRTMSPVDVMTHKYIVIENPEAAFKTLLARASK